MNPLKSFILLLVFALFGCKSEEKCGEIYDKVTRNGRYFFVLDPAFSLDVSTANDNASFLPDNRVSGEVSQSVYEQFSIGEEYCQ